HPSSRILVTSIREASNSGRAYSLGQASQNFNPVEKSGSSSGRLISLDMPFRACGPFNITYMHLHMSHSSSLKGTAPKNLASIALLSSAALSSSTSFIVRISFRFRLEFCQAQCPDRVLQLSRL